MNLQTSRTDKLRDLVTLHACCLAEKASIWLTFARETRNARRGHLPTSAARCQVLLARYRGNRPVLAHLLGISQATFARALQSPDAGLSPRTLHRLLALDREHRLDELEDFRRDSTQHILRMPTIDFMAPPSAR